MNQTDDYPYIRAWGAMLGSFAYYIDGEVERARRENAPPTAYAHRHEGGWLKLEDITNPLVRADLVTAVERMKAQR